MFAASAFKKAALATGLYGTARRLYQRAFNRKHLAKVRADAQFYRDLIPAGSLCFDVGANLGQRAEAMLEAGMRVVAFEPQADCVRELKERSKRFNGSLHVEQTALGAEAGEAALNVTRMRLTSSLRGDWHPGDVVRQEWVPVTTLDAATGQFGIPHYIKIDVEGHELEVLRGLSAPIPLISFEYHRDDLESMAACLHELTRFGDLMVNVTPGDELRFGFPGWLPAGEFKARFPVEFSGRDEFTFGDCFVQLI